jgi:hypothetical protein
MNSRDRRADWLIVVPGVILAIWVMCAAAVVWQGLGPRAPGFGDRLVRMVSSLGQEAHGSAPRAETGPTRMSDPRLASLRRAADTWKRSERQERKVVDQVCLVPDVESFFHAIAAWDEHAFFPILIDEPAWTLPFVRAFGPARVVRYESRRGQLVEASPSGAGFGLPDGPDAVWSQALLAVARAWTMASESDNAVPDAGLPPRHLGAVPPGIVLAAPQAPMLAGAVALAAGRFQPLVRLPASADEAGLTSGSARASRFGEVMSVPRACWFARTVEARVAAVVPAYDQLGDDCDFVTLAADWPFRYSCDIGNQPIRGIYALDDLIGRRFEPAAGLGWLNQARRRWAYTGRLLGDPAASVARAMGSLFLQPSSALLWNTYGGGNPWSDYTMVPAAPELAPATGTVGTVVERSGAAADLASWHQVVDPVNRFGLVLINSSGGPDWFNISGGVGRPSDLPRSVPATVAMIHSFSAADPTDPQTIAGRWLAHGAFNYFGAVNEPFLLAFRPPRLVAELIASGMPLVAALRQGEDEAFGIPWRLCYLGDPLYRLEPPALMPGHPSSTKEKAQSAHGGRMGPIAWQSSSSTYALWPVSEISSVPSVSEQAKAGRVTDSETARFRWCWDASIAEAAGRPVRASGAPVAAADGWRQALRAIRRDRLAPNLRPLLDDLVIDDLEALGACEELMSRLAQVPATERGPRAWQALETCGMTRLARLTRDGLTTAGFIRVLDLWDEVMGLSWPSGSRFPAHYTERVAALARSDSHRHRLWLDRLERAGRASTIQPGAH